MSTRREFLHQTAAASLLAATSIQSSQANGEASDSIAAAKKPTGLVRLAIVGTGQISHRYLKQAAEGKRARFVATCARTLESAKARAAEYGIEAWFDDYEKMYDEVKPDGVVIATPSTCTPKRRSPPWSVASRCCARSPWRSRGRIARPWSPPRSAAARSSWPCRSMPRRRS